MGVSRVRSVRRRKKKDVEKALKWIVYPPVILGAVLFRSNKNNRKKRSKRK